MHPPTVLILILAGLSLAGSAGAQEAAPAGQMPQPAPSADAQPAEKKEPTPEEKYRARMPQEVEVARLIGLDVIDDEEQVLGSVRDIVRMDDGGLHVVFDYLSFFGYGGRLVPLPIEMVAVVGQRLAVMEVPIGVIAKTKTWYGLGGSSLGPEEKVAVALTKF